MSNSDYGRTTGQHEQSTQQAAMFADDPEPTAANREEFYADDAADMEMESRREI